MNDYMILGNGKRNYRICVLLFAAFSLVTVIAVQIVHAVNGTPSETHRFLLYGAELLMLLAGIFRSYFFFLAATVYCTLRQVVALVLIAMREGAFTSPVAFDAMTTLALLFLSASLAWQTILFFFGHADNVALTHTSLIFVILSLVLTFLPYMMLLFMQNPPVAESYNVVFLALSFLAFSGGIEKKPAA